MCYDTDRSADNDSLGGCVDLTGGVKLAPAAVTGSRLVFETTDLEGKPVKSEEIFSGHAITMINMWATWCDPGWNRVRRAAVKISFGS